MQTFGKQFSSPNEFRCRKRGFPNTEKGVREPGLLSRSGGLPASLPARGRTIVQHPLKTLSSSSSRKSGSTKAEAFNDSAFPISGSTKNSFARRSVKLLEPSSYLMSSKDGWASNGSGRAIHPNRARLLSKTKADSDDHGRLMFVTRSLNCNVLPAIG